MISEFLELYWFIEQSTDLF